MGLLGKGKDKKSFLSQFPEQSYHLSTAVKILPLSLIFVGMISFNNLCLQNVQVSFYLVARSLTILFNVIFTFVLLHTTTSFPVIVTLCIVVFGFIIGSKGEIDFSITGTVFGVCSSIFVSLNSIYTKKLMHIVDNNSWILCFYNNMNSCFLFVPLIIYFEKDTILQYVPVLSSPAFWGWMTLAGVLGFLIGIVTILQIQLTSPLTHNIVGTVKACLQTFLAVFKGETMTLQGLIGNLSVLFGSFLYSFVRNREMDAAKKRAKANDTDLEKDDVSEDRPLLKNANKV